MSRSEEKYRSPRSSYGNAEFGSRFAPFYSTAFMSATPTNPKLRTPEAGERPGAASAPQQRPRTSYEAPGREALQTLLAFSSLHDQIRRRQQRGAGAADVGSAPAPGERFFPDEVLQLISERALAITGTDGVAIALAEGKEVRCRAAAGTMAPDVGVRLDPSSGFSGACFRTGLIVRCDDTEKDPRVDQQACRRIGVRSIVAVPLLTERGVIGLIAAFCRETHGVSDGDIRSLSLLAELALAALEPEPAAVGVKTFQRAQAKQEGDASSGDPQTAGKASLPNLQALRDTLSPVTDERTAVNVEPAENAGQDHHELFQAVQSRHKSGRLIVAIVMLAALALVLAGLTLWWWHTGRHAVSRVFQSEPSSKSTAIAPAVPAPQPATEPQAAEDMRETSARQITGIRHWSSPDSTTVAIDLKEQVQYEAHRLSNPERIYFDLRDTTLASGVPGDVEVGDPLLSRIRVAQASDDLTRVVLETKSNPAFSVKLENNPYRLLIEIHSAAEKSKHGAKVDLFAPLNSADKNARLASATPEQGTWLAPVDESPEAGSTALQGSGHTLRIVLDAGHGGWDMGTVGRKGLLEKDLVLDIVARLGKLVTSRIGAEVIYTRRDDSYIPLEKRTETANSAQADLFLSVHANYSDSPTARGVETYYTNTYSSARSRQPDGTPEALNAEWLNVDIRGKVRQSRGFADDVQQALYHTLAAENRALRNRGVKEASYVVLTGTTMPAVLAEVSFVSSPEDEAELESAAYRQKIAEGLCKGIAAYAESQRRVSVASASVRTGGQ